MNKLSKQLMALFFSVLIFVESGFNAAITGHAAEINTGSHFFVYTVKAVAGLQRDDGEPYLTVKYGTQAEELKLPEKIYALATVKDVEQDEADEEEDEIIEISTASEVEIISTVSELTETETVAETTENVEEAASKSEINTSVDCITKDQMDELSKLLSAKEKPAVKKLEAETGLDLSSYKVIELSVEWINDTAFGGSYDPEKPDVYRFYSEVTADSTKYVVDEALLPCIDVRVLGEDEVKFYAQKTIDDVEITVSAPAGVFPEGSELEVEKIDSKSDTLKINEAVNKTLDNDEVVRNSLSYDIKVKDKDGNVITPEEADSQKIEISFGSEAFKEAAQDEKQYISIYHFENVDKETVEKAAKSSLEELSFIESLVDAFASLFSFQDEDNKLSEPEYVEAEKIENVEADASEKKESAEDTDCKADIKEDSEADIEGAAENDDVSDEDTKPVLRDDSSYVTDEGEITVKASGFSVYSIVVYSKKSTIKPYYSILSLDNASSYSYESGDMLTLELTSSDESSEVKKIAAIYGPDDFEKFAESVSQDPTDLEELLQDAKVGSTIEIPANADRFGFIADSEGIKIKATALMRDGIRYEAFSEEVTRDADDIVTFKGIRWNLKDTLYAHSYSIKQNITKGGGVLTPSELDAIDYTLSGFNAGETVKVKLDDGSEETKNASEDGTLFFSVKASVAAFGVLTNQADIKVVSAAGSEGSKNNIVCATDIKDFSLSSAKENELNFVVPEITYPVYFETENVNGSVTFRVGDVETGREIKAYLLDSEGKNVSETLDVSNQTKTSDDGSKAECTFNVNISSGSKGYHLLIESDDPELTLLIENEGNKYQNRAGVGTEPVKLASADKNSSDSKSAADKSINSFFIEGKASKETVKTLWEDGGRTEEEKGRLIAAEDVENWKNEGKSSDEINKLVKNNVREQMKLEYYIDADIEGKGRIWKTLDVEAMKELGYADGMEIPSPLNAEFTYQGPTTYEYDFVNKLFTRYVYRDETTGEIKTAGIKYRISESDKLKQHYFGKYEDENGNETETGSILRNYEIKDYTATVKWNDKDATAVDRPSIDKWFDSIEVKRISKNDKGKAVTEEVKKIRVSTASEIPLSSNAEGAVTITDTGNGIWTVTVRGYAYNRYDHPVHYYITEKQIDLPDIKGAGGSGSAVTDRCYKIKYENVGNSSDIETGLYDGGTLQNTLSGKTGYAIKKLWKDEAVTDKNDRPKAYIRLYRYAKSEVDPWAHLSPIEKEEDRQIVDSIDTNDGRKDVLYGLTVSQLDAYNEDGEKLIYVGKEKMNGGKFDYENRLLSKDGKEEELHGGYYVLDGETLVNRVKGTLTVKATKTWRATARQDTDAKVQFYIYKTTVNPSTYDLSRYMDELDQSLKAGGQSNDNSRSVLIGGDQTKYVERLADNCVLEGFSSEERSKSLSFSEPKYDEEGRRLYYVVREGAVSTRVGSEFKETDIETINGKTYYVTQDGYRYLQSKSPKTDADGNVETEIVNTLIGNAQIKIVKHFPEGLSESDIRSGKSTITFDVYQNKKKIGTVTRTYDKNATLGKVNADGEFSSHKIGSIEELSHEFTDEILITSYDDEVLKLDDSVKGFTGLLPRYTPDGAEYTYTAFEHEDVIERGYNPMILNMITEPVYKVSSPSALRPYRENRDKYLLDTIEISNQKDKGDKATSSEIPATSSTVPCTSSEIPATPSNVPEEPDAPATPSFIRNKNLITVYKEWLDGAESDGRESVTFVLEHEENGKWVQYGGSHVINPMVKEDNVSSSDEEEDSDNPDETKYSKFVCFRVPEEIKEEFNAWRDNGYKDNGTSGKFRVREIKVGDAQVKYYTGAGRTIKDDFENSNYYLGHFFDKYEGVESRFEELSKNQAENDKYGFVKGNKYDYDVLLDDGTEHIGYGKNIPEEEFDFVLTNVRVGVIYVNISKEWNDGDMSAKTRPDAIKLKVRVGDEVRVETLDKNNNWKVTLGPFRKYDADGKLIDYAPKLLEFTDGEYSSSEHEYKTTNRFEKFVYAAGREDDAGKYAEAYKMSGKSDAVFTLGNDHDHHTGESYDIALSNTLSGTVTPVVNKFWEDYEEKAKERPQIFANLYRSYVDPQGTHFEQVYKQDNDNELDYNWETKIVELSYNWWKITYSSMPRFKVVKSDSKTDFYEYTYYVGETYAANNTNEYEEIGAYPKAPEYADAEKKAAVFTYDVPKCTPSTITEGKDKGKTVYAAPVPVTDDEKEGTLINRPRNKRTVSGTKIYENLPEGFSSKNLPTVKLELWRVPYGVKVKDLEKLSADERKKLEEPVYQYSIGKDEIGQEVLIKDPDEKMLTAELKGANELRKRTFTFYNRDKDGNETREVAQVPKYDDNGRPYTYFVKETAITDTEKTTLANIYDAKYDVDSEDALTNGIQVTNGFVPTDKYKVTFYKKWDGLTDEKHSDAEYMMKYLAEDNYAPYITVRLYRYLQDDKGERIQGTEELVLDKVEDNNGNKTQEIVYYDTTTRKYSACRKDHDGNSVYTNLSGDNVSGYSKEHVIHYNHSHEYTWDNLEYYAPNLRPYIYVVSEKYESNATVTNSFGYEEVYEASGSSLKKKDGAANLYELYKLYKEDKTNNRKDNEDKYKNRIVEHDSNWVGYDIAVDGSYTVGSETEPEEGSGTAAIINGFQKTRFNAIIKKSWVSDKQEYDDIRVTPSEIKFELYKAKDSSVNWTKGIDTCIDTITLQSPEWSKEVKDLLYREPRGYRNRYYFKEVLPEGWEKVFYIEPSEPAVFTLDRDFTDKENKTVTVTAANKFKTVNLKVNKVFTDSVKGNPISEKILKLMYVHGVIPDSIKYQVYYQIDGDTEWKLLEKLSDDGKTKTAVEISSTFGSETGEYSEAEATGLMPYAYKEGDYHPVKYRAVEVSVTYGSAEVDRMKDYKTSIEAELCDGQKAETGFGGFASVSSTFGATEGPDNDATKCKTITTTVTNSIALTKLDVTKLWKDEVRGRDNEIRSVNFKLQRKTEGGDWAYIVDEKENDDKISNPEISLTRTKNQTEQTGVFEYLPTRDKYGNKYYYRAVESKIVLNTGKIKDIKLKQIKDEGTKGETATGEIGAYEFKSQNGTRSKGKKDDIYTEVLTTRTTNRLKLGKISVSKNWVDDNDKYGLRPSEISIKLDSSSGVKGLNGSDEPEVIILNKDNEWKAEWDKLPVYDKYGKEITYTLTELESKEGMDSYKATNSVLMHVEKKSESTAGSDEAASSGLAALRKESEGRVAKDVKLTDGETTEVDFTNTLVTTSFIVEKCWDTAETDPTDANADFVRNVGVILQRSTDGTNWENVKNYLDADGNRVTTDNDITEKLTAANAYICTWNDLPKYGSDGREFLYRAEETSLETVRNGNTDNPDKTGDSIGGYNYELKLNGSNDGVQRATLSNILKKGDYAVTKVWIDDDNRDRLRPDEITFQLQRRLSSEDKWTTLASGSEITIRKQRAAKEGSWSVATWSNLPVKGANGEDYIYRAVEKETDKNYVLFVETANSEKGILDYIAGFFGNIVDFLHKALIGGETENKEDTENKGVILKENGLVTATYSNIHRINTVEVTVEKKWEKEIEGVEKNVTGAEVAIQRSTDSIIWKPAKLEGSEDELVHVITRKEGSWTVKDLPEHAKDGEKYMYRAIENGICLSDGSFIEVNDDGKTEGTVGPYAYTSETEENDHKFKTVITNRMDTSSIRPPKIRNDDNDSGSDDDYDVSRRIRRGVDTPGDDDSTNDKIVLGKKRPIPSDSSTSTSSVKPWNPQTGDDSSMVYYGIGALVSLMILGVWFYLNKRRKN
ncbi:hypothetical protein BXO88_06710 [Oribacterium sp. C9]|uniref:Cna B-type domain-containing protein n=1 Tax=Oribacterium sp. C9 TaxID=1943579 RepID=UPI00098F8A88|nr:Cna B-type domain-containing protein [Oribacterium sp. C9]OON86678.1 hypothetical protein BXO88_06710 [Oribacterium sp. C9]